MDVLAKLRFMPREVSVPSFVLQQAAAGSRPLTHHVKAAYGNLKRTAHPDMH